MPYTILLTLTFESIVQTLFFGWLWYKLHAKQPLMIEYPQAYPTAPLYDDKADPNHSYPSEAI